MIRLLLRPVELALLGLIGYNLVTALFGWRDPDPVPAGRRERRLRVVVPAHNEAKVVGGLLEDLDGQGHPGARIVVLADHCEDATARIAAEAGVEVVERDEGAGGKGPALSWYISNHPLDPDEALVVLDADNRVPGDLLDRFSDALDQGHHVLQAYLGVSNPDASPLATASALSYWASNRMVQLARRNLGWTADLGGTGMCVTAEALDVVGGFGSSLAEDQELGVKLFEAGYPVVWLHDVEILDEKPVSSTVAVRQRSRWAAGRAQVAKQHVPQLLATRNPVAIDLAIRLAQPSRMSVAMGSGLLALGSLVSLPTLGFRLWATVSAIQVLAPLPFLWKEGVDRKYLLRYPVLVFLPLLKIPVRLVKQSGWYHTPHTG